MKLMNVTVCLSFVFGLVLTSSLPALAAERTADAVFDDAIKAMGGAERIKTFAYKAQYTVVDEKPQLNFKSAMLVLETALPGKHLLDRVSTETGFFADKGRVVRLVFNGSGGRSVDRGRSGNHTVLYTRTEMEGWFRKHEFHAFLPFTLVQLRERKDLTREYLGEVKGENGGRLHRVRIKGTFPDDPKSFHFAPEILYFDAETHRLAIRENEIQTAFSRRTAYSGYQKSDGIDTPRLIESHYTYKESSDLHQTIKITSFKKIDEPRAGEFRLPPVPQIEFRFD